MPTDASINCRYASIAAIGLLVCALIQTSADAREIHYRAVDDRALLECDERHWRGEIDKSTICYTALLERDAAPAIKAEAAWALNDLQEANRWFQRALTDSPDETSTRVRWGDLYADSHQDAEAMEIYREALAQDPDHSFARLGAARVLVGNFDDAAKTYLNALLADSSVNSGARVGAWLLVARIALESGNRDEGLSAIEEAAALIEANEWPPLEIYALRAAADLLGNIQESRWTGLSLAYNPRYGGIYSVPAHFYVITRRYRDAIDLYLKAIEIEPGLAAAHEDLGVNLLRDNQISRARRHLEIAYREDPFSPIAVNTLRLLDSFADFRRIDFRPEKPGATSILLRLHKDEADAIAPYAMQLARQSIAEFSDRYDFVLQEPVIIEMYPDHEDFAVRTAGMPGLGILGATFGYVVAMDSPSGRPPHVFQWGTTLWHEMAHVFTLEASNHLVPRWFSEGVSVLEEWRSGPNPGVRIPLSVYGAMQDDRLLPIAELDEGFIRPTYDEQVIVSYMQAGLVCQFVDKEFGIDKLRGLLNAYRDGLQTPEAIESVLGVKTAEFDKLFSDFVAVEHGEVLQQLEHWHKTQAVIANKTAAGQWDDVIELASDLLEILPRYIEPDSPYLALAQANEELGRQAEALESLEQFWRNGGYDPVALKKLSQLLLTAERPQDAIAVLQTVNLVDPLDRELHGVLGDMLLDAGRAGDALQEFEIALALEPHDMATAWYRLARAHYQLGNTKESQANLLRALDVAPNFRPAQRLLLKLADNVSQ